nr:MAG TPA: hypothetical protein [Caudoviricetes sp.]
MTLSIKRLYYTHRSSKRTDKQVSGNNTAAMLFKNLESQAAALKDRRLNQGLGRATANAEAQSRLHTAGQRHAETVSPDPLIKTTTQGNAKCLI